MSDPLHPLLVWLLLVFSIVGIGALLVAINDSIAHASARHYSRVRRLNRYADRQRDRSYRPGIG